MPTSIKPKRIEYNPNENEFDYDIISLSYLRSIVNELTSSALKVYIYCVNQHNEENPSIDYLAVNAQLPMGKTSYHREITELLNKGYLNTLSDGSFLFSLSPQLPKPLTQNQAKPDAVITSSKKAQWVYDF